ncbi:SpoIIIAH-like family protein [Niallia taxi]|uniref:SpoIIIAH-like family protein n=1 Tax=Niallia taxi TaxID=2499688 RepID=A0A3S2X4U2_9BACI|nr:SpoIIIAH-like family protein [Niallia taxi]MCM3215423.1 SpoIIIAH-like family protein [Niallia taxi]MDK8639725.1 SpoIIIAH-like family protein [Niallia taxi]MED4038099.1 SpoIIIAH-like family protein [Niallia taxi]MED4055494.1 SpoIIIAH-like family protein [Niallia taxi]MED4117685.1 SpoIIIAH-like family protein [Niallia taxi]
MLLKKQTVWLLTMLSLVVVLTVYYTTSPEQTNEFAATEDAAKENTAKEKATENAKGEQAAEDGSSVSTIASDEVFEEMRLQLDEQRSKEEEQLTETMSEAKTAEEKSAAQDKIEELQKLSDNEKMMETLIKAENYDDVLVRAVDGKVNVTVKAGELSAEAANDIVQLVRENLNQPNAFVAVKIDPK